MATINAISNTIPDANLTVIAGNLYIGTAAPAQPSRLSIEESVAGTTGMSIQNPLVNVSAAAVSQFIVEPAAGDAYSSYIVNGGATWSAGLDNSDTDAFKITTGSSPSAGTEVFKSTTAGAITFNNLVTVSTGGLTVTAGDGAFSEGNFSVTKTTAASNTRLQCINTSNTAGSTAQIETLVAGATAADPFVRFGISATRFWSIGIDNSDSDSFKINTDTSGVDPSIGTNVMKITTAGEFTYQLQPAFLGRLNTTDVNVSGTGTVYQLGTNTALTEVFDQNADFNTNGTFTAPVTGRYHLEAQLWVTGTTVATSLRINLVTSNRTYSKIYNRVAAATDFVQNITVLADMDATDTAVVQVVTSGEAGDTDDLLGGATVACYFSGYLAC